MRAGEAPPPWPAVPGVPGPARGRPLKPPHPRHTIAGAKTGQVKGENTVYLRGYERAIRDDVRQIAAGNAQWERKTGRYTINGRIYGVKQTGLVFPISGVGLVKLDRNEYSALKMIAQAGGDPNKVAEFSRDPVFVGRPQVIATARAIYDGTYPE